MAQHDCTFRKIEVQLKDKSTTEVMNLIINLFWLSEAKNLVFVKEGPE